MAQAEVAQFRLYVSALVEDQENVRGLDVAVYNVLRVHLPQCRRYLQNNGKELRLVHLAQSSVGAQVNVRALEFDVVGSVGKHSDYSTYRAPESFVLRYFGLKRRVLLLLRALNNGSAHQVERYLSEAPRRVLITRIIVLHFFFYCIIRAKP